MDKRSRARVGAAFFVALAAAAVAVTMSMGWLAAEDRWRPNLVLGIPRYRLFTCGFVRRLPIVGAHVSAVPCQFWNLMPLTGVGVLFGGWLVLDLVKGALGLPVKKSDHRGRAAPE